MKLPKLPDLRRLDPRTWTWPAWDRAALAAAFGLGAVAVLLWLPEPALRNPLAWTIPQWVSLLLLVLVVTGLVVLHGAVAWVREVQEAQAEEVSQLQGRLDGLTEQLHTLRLEQAKTTEIPAVHVDPAPTTITGLPSARPPVPNGSTAPEKRGKHAAAD